LSVKEESQHYQFVLNIRCVAQSVTSSLKRGQIIWYHNQSFEKEKRWK